MTPGQQQALQQLHAIALASETLGEPLEIVSVKRPAEAGRDLWIDVSVSCKSMLDARVEDGLPLQDRERFSLAVPADFPFQKPSAWVTHDRFAGFPHVQWKHSLCLYQASDVEWNASDGMFGFMTRLDEWLRRGVRGELDETGAPLHPPVAYAKSDAALAIIRADTPEAQAGRWLGAAHLRLADNRVDVLGWSHLGEPLPKGVPLGAAVLLPEALPFEYPDKGEQLLAHFERAGVPIEDLLDLLQIVVLANEKGTPLYIAVGAPGRGIKGIGNLKYHLAVWRLDHVTVDALRLSLYELHPDPQLSAIGGKARGLVRDWLKATDVAWCRVAEERPQIVTRRDERSPLGWVRGRAISVWGCGALGGTIAECLVRAGVRKIVLRDGGMVTPGLLVRQNFTDADVGKPKADALADRLRRIRPDVEVDAKRCDILTDPLAGTDWTDGAELVIDATASDSVAKKLEARLTQADGRRAPIVSAVVGHDASMGLAVFASPSWTGGAADAYRKAKLAACAGPELREFADEFWPTKARDFFQPEPGCSSPTFAGSAADAVSMAGALLNVAVSGIAGGEPAGAFFIPAVWRRDRLSPKRFSWQNDLVIPDAVCGYEVRIQPSAKREMSGWISRSARLKGPRVETGGLLFGEIDNAARVIWVSEVSGPPPDSTASPTGFVCGTTGTQKLNRELRERSRGSVTFVGTWHTHPGMAARPSDVDLSGMHKIVCSPDFRAPRSLLLIAGGDVLRQPHYTAMLFERSRFEAVGAGV